MVLVNLSTMFSILNGVGPVFLGPKSPYIEQVELRLAHMKMKMNMHTRMCLISCSKLIQV